ncbi:MAG: aspartate aminotransferase family protein [Verrucomicrobia bacterium]|nr:aspartate aminotransferase family protein [Verrucomicrobiota bacterium]
MMTATQQVIEQLRRFESRNVTFLEPDGSWPIVWDRAAGTQVWDLEGKEYLDLTAAFGVAAAGHANPRVVAAGQAQMGRLLHAMGDVHPHALKAQLAARLSQLTFGRWNQTEGKTVFCNSGFEAVEVALKTALLATGRRRILSFAGGYHGLGYGALNATDRGLFREPFLSQLSDFGESLLFPANATELDETMTRVKSRLATGEIGAVLLEPMQARGGIRIPPPSFLTRLRDACDEHGALLILDEIYTGFGRTGRWFACEHSSVVPDLICLGKALTGGFPLSACVGRSELMDAAWPRSQGEAIHTSTFLGHPVGCAMALAQIDELTASNLVQESERKGQAALESLVSLAQKLENSRWTLTARGCGLFLGLEITLADGQPGTAMSLSIIKDLLHEGFILLPEGSAAEVISLTPPLTIHEQDLQRTLQALEIQLRRYL